MRVFLAGGTGVIGRALVPQLRAAGHEVTAMTRYESRAERLPRRVPRFIARLVAGKFGLYMTTQLQGATNAKAKRELGWQPRWASWRDGFREALG